MRQLGALLFVASVFVVAGCSPSSAPPVDQPTGGGPPEGDCAVSEVEQQDGTCLSPGVQPDGCRAGEVATAGGCRPAGVAPDGCGEGFDHDGIGACDPIIVDTCPAGMIAVPGDTSCRDVAPCGSGTWGDVPIDATTQYVDLSFVGASDGTVNAPWTTIQQAVNVAVGSVAIAAGDYAEDVVVSGPVQLWGVCPSLVSTQSVSVVAGVVELHTLALSGAADGVNVQGASVSLDRLWIHDTAGFGLRALLSSTVMVSGTLIEAVYERGIYTEGGSVEVDGCAIRDLVAAPKTPNFGGGRAINIRDDTTSGARGNGVVRNTYITGVTESGIMVHASDATIETTVVRDVAPSLEGRFGRGVNVQMDVSTGERGDALIRQSVFERMFDGGIVITGGNAVIEATTVRDVASNFDVGDRGYGIVAQPTPSPNTPASAEIRSSWVERASEVGIFIAGASATIEATAVVDTRPTEAMGIGRGISVQYDDGVGAALTLRSSRITGATEVGLYVGGSSSTAEGLLIEGVDPRPVDGMFGRGIDMESEIQVLVAPSLTLRWSIVRDTTEVGVATAGGDAVVESTIVSETKVGVVSPFGAGFTVRDFAELDASLTVSDSLVEQMLTVGIVVAGAHATITKTLVTGTRADNEMNFGDGIALVATGKTATVLVDRSRIEGSARVGAISFGGELTLADTTLICNPIHLAKQDLVFDGTLFDAGGNSCGCDGVSTKCKVSATDLQPPEPPSTTQ
jgi:hypothetical protein